MTSLTSSLPINELDLLFEAIRFILFNEGRYNHCSSGVSKKKATVVVDNGMLLCPWGARRQAGTVCVPKIYSAIDSVILDLLDLSLKKAGKDYKIIVVDEQFSEERTEARVASGQLDVLWVGNQRELSTKLRPIKIPILKGLYGYRILVIRKGEQAHFDRLQNLNDIKKLMVGVGWKWGGVPNWQDAGFTVVLARKNDSLWQMLHLYRFDFLPLSTFEPWLEIQDYQASGLDITVEQNLMLVYPRAKYFYVAPENEALYQDIYQGMMKAMRDGSYDELLYSSKQFQDAIHKGGITRRRIIRIPLSKTLSEVDTSNKLFQLDIEKLKTFESL